MNNIAIFASGTGSNAEVIINYFYDNFSDISVATLISNNSNSGAIARAQNHNIPTKIFTSKTLRESPQTLLDYLTEMEIDYIVLAGFMVLMPHEIVEKYPQKILNIHPALLPKFGGKGMYGSNVHRAVIENKEKTSGITIHFVDENYDSGSVIFQASVDIAPGETPESLALKIQKLEHAHFPQIIESVILKGTSKN